MQILSNEAVKARKDPRTNPVDIGRLSTYLYDERLGSGRYVNANTGRIVSFAEVDRALAQATDDLEETMARLGSLVARGEISERAFYEAMTRTVKHSYNVSVALAKGGWHNVPNEEWGRNGGLLRVEYGRLVSFANDIADGRYTNKDGERSEAAIVARARLYANTAYGRYWQIEDGRRLAGSDRYEQLVTVGDDRTCDECHGLEGYGWVPIGTHSLPIHPGCRCRKEYSAVFVPIATKHGGPGAHSGTGTSQDVHGQPGGEAAWGGPTPKGVEWLRRAVERYGLTDSVLEAGFILPDGKMLDFNRTTGIGGARGLGEGFVHHGDLGDIEPERNPTAWEYPAFRFMKETGALRLARFSSSSSNIGLAIHGARPLTAAQRSLLSGLPVTTVIWEVDDFVGNELEGDVVSDEERLPDSWVSEFDAALRRARPATKHAGPGNHPSGSSQDVHGQSGGGADRAGRAKKWLAATKRKMKVTDNIYEAAFILPDGSLLSGDHAEVRRSEPPISAEEEWSTSSQFRFQRDTGAIRMWAYPSGSGASVEMFVEAVHLPTAAQRKRLDELEGLSYVWQVSGSDGYERSGGEGDTWGPAVLRRFEAALRGAATKHAGPGPHPGTGTSQDVHGGGKRYDYNALEEVDYQGEKEMRIHRTNNLDEAMEDVLAHKPSGPLGVELTVNGRRVLLQVSGYSDHMFMVGAIDPMEESTCALLVKKIEEAGYPEIEVWYPNRAPDVKGETGRALASVARRGEILPADSYAYQPNRSSDWQRPTLERTRSWTVTANIDKLVDRDLMPEGWRSVSNMQDKVARLYEYFHPDFVYIDPRTDGRLLADQIDGLCEARREYGVTVDLHALRWIGHENPGAIAWTPHHDDGTSDIEFFKSHDWKHSKMRGESSGYFVRNDSLGLAAHEYAHALHHYAGDGAVEFSRLLYSSVGNVWIRRHISGYATKNEFEFFAETLSGIEFKNPEANEIRRLLLASVAPGPNFSNSVAGRNAEWNKWNDAHQRRIIDETQAIHAETRAAWTEKVAKHAGPGNHPSGSPQSVHGQPGGEAAWQAAHGQQKAPPDGERRIVQEAEPQDISVAGTTFFGVRRVKSIKDAIHNARAIDGEFFVWEGEKGAIAFRMDLATAERSLQVRSTEVSANDLRAIVAELEGTDFTQIDFAPNVRTEESVAAIAQLKREGVLMPGDGFVGEGLVLSANLKAYKKLKALGLQNWEPLENPREVIPYLHEYFADEVLVDKFCDNRAVLDAIRGLEQGKETYPGAQRLTRLTMIARSGGDVMGEYHSMSGGGRGQMYLFSLGDYERTTRILGYAFSDKDNSGDGYDYVAYHEWVHNAASPVMHGSDERARKVRNAIDNEAIQAGPMRDWIRKNVSSYAVADNLPDEFVAELMAGDVSSPELDHLREIVGKTVLIDSPSASEDLGVWIRDWKELYLGKAAKHAGPGDHPSGSPQSVHGERDGENEWQRKRREMEAARERADQAAASAKPEPFGKIRIGSSNFPPNEPWRGHRGYAQLPHGRWLGFDSNGDEKTLVTVYADKPHGGRLVSFWLPRGRGPQQFINKSIEDPAYLDSFIYSPNGAFAATTPWVQGVAWSPKTSQYMAHFEFEDEGGVPVVAAFGWSYDNRYQVDFYRKSDSRLLWSSKTINEPRPLDGSIVAGVGAEQVFDAWIGLPYHSASRLLEERLKLPYALDVRGASVGDNREEIAKYIAALPLGRPGPWNEMRAYRLLDFEGKKFIAAVEPVVDLDGFGSVGLSFFNEKGELHGYRELHGSNSFGSWDDVLNSALIRDGELAYVSDDLLVEHRPPKWNANFNWVAAANQKVDETTGNFYAILESGGNSRRSVMVVGERLPSDVVEPGLAYKVTYRDARTGVLLAQEQVGAISTDVDIRKRALELHDSNVGFLYDVRDPENLDLDAAMGGVSLYDHTNWSSPEASLVRNLYWRNGDNGDGGVFVLSPTRAEGALHLPSFSAFEQLFADSVYPAGEGEVLKPVRLGYSKPQKVGSASWGYLEGSSDFMARAASYQMASNGMLATDEARYLIGEENVDAYAAGKFSPESDAGRSGLKDNVTKSVAKVLDKWNLDSSYYAASAFVAQWAESSNKTLASAIIQEEASKLFGVPLSAYQRQNLALWSTKRKNLVARYETDFAMTEPARDATVRLPFEGYVTGIDEEKSRSMVREVLKSMYDATQRDLAAAGVSKVELFRGVSTKAQIETGATGRGTAILRSNALESWTTSPKTAGEFGNVVMGATFPRQRIFCTPRTGFGCWPEWEFVVIGDHEKDEVTVYNNDRSPR